MKITEKQMNTFLNNCLEKFNEVDTKKLKDHLVYYQSKRNQKNWEVMIELMKLLTKEIQYIRNSKKTPLIYSGPWFKKQWINTMDWFLNAIPKDSTYSDLEIALNYWKERAEDDFEEFSKNVYDAKAEIDYSKKLDQFAQVIKEAKWKIQVDDNDIKTINPLQMWNALSSKPEPPFQRMIFDESEIQ